MPRTLFDQTLAPRSRNARPLGTLSLSIVLHAGALTFLLALQLTSSIRALDIAPPLRAFVAPPASVPEPPPARVAARSATAAVATAPVVEPETISAEPPFVVRPAAPGVPTGLAMGPPGDVGSLLSAGAALTPMNAPPPAPDPKRVGGEIRAPARLVYVPPEYPSLARTARVEGEVVLEATIDEAGVVRDVKVLHSIPFLDRAAIDAVSRWRYSPTLLNGQAVAVILQVRVRFTLK